MPKNKRKAKAKGAAGGGEVASSSREAGSAHSVSIGESGGTERVPGGVGVGVGGGVGGGAREGGQNGRDRGRGASENEAERAAPFAAPPSPSLCQVFEERIEVLMS
jgi:hypothetical protein